MGSTWEQGKFMSPTDQEIEEILNIRMIACAVLGHSRIITSFFGHQHCGRCGDQIGDTLSITGIGISVGIGHNCESCYENYKLMTWRDKLFVRNPLTGPMVPEVEQFKKLCEDLERISSEIAGIE